MARASLYGLRYRMRRAVSTVAVLYPIWYRSRIYLDRNYVRSS